MPNQYIVKKGDTLWGIAKQHQVSLAELKQANPHLKQPDQIFPGNEITIPMKVPNQIVPGDKITIPDKTLGNKEVGQICETCQEKSCLKIILLSENGYPYVGEKYTIKLGNTLIQAGSLDKKGSVSLKNIEAGNYIVEFPTFKSENFSLESELGQSSEEQITCGTTLSERELREFDKPILFTLPANNTYRIIVFETRIEILVGGPYMKHGKEQPYGHVALRVITSQSDITYDYGRYSRVWGIGNSEGDGILRIWTDFTRYIAGEKATGRTTVGYRFRVTAAEANQVNDHFMKIIKGQEPNQVRGEYMKQYKINDYHALNSNCTTISIDGATQAIPNLMQGSEPFNIGGKLSTTEKLAAKLKGWPNRIFMPADLGNFLTSLQGNENFLKTEIYKK